MPAIQQPNNIKADQAELLNIEESSDKKQYMVWVKFFNYDTRVGGAMVELSKRKCAGLEIDDDSDRQQILLKALKELELTVISE